MLSKKQGNGPKQAPPGTSAESQHNDWGHGQAGAARNAQSGVGGNIGGVPGGKHEDWGHSPVGKGGKAQTPAPAGLPRQGVMPGEEMGHLR